MIVVGETGSGKTTQLTQVNRLCYFVETFSVFCILEKFLLGWCGQIELLVAGNLALTSGLTQLH